MSDRPEALTGTSVERTLRGFALATCLFAIGCLGVGLMSGTIRSSVSLVATRAMARVWTPEYALIGDSRMRDCNWRDHLSWNPIKVVNLAVGGSSIGQTQQQAAEANSLRARRVLIASGINDVVLEDAPVHRIADDFDRLLRRLGDDHEITVSLIAYTSKRQQSSRIDSANASLRRLSELRGLRVVDLNSELSDAAVLKPEMTTDGVHFSAEACRVWAEMLNRQNVSAMQTRLAPW